MIEQAPITNDSRLSTISQQKNVQSEKRSSQANSEIQLTEAENGKDNHDSMDELAESLMND